jgi:hypothetical protein
MKRKKKKRSVHNTISIKKASEMILDVAMGLIEMGEDLEEKQNYLNLACTAWNISLLPESKRNDAIEQCVAEYRNMNDDVDEEDCNNIRENYKLIIKHKVKAYPFSQKQMIDAIVEIIDGETKVNVMSFDPERQ